MGEIADTFGEMVDSLQGGTGRGRNAVRFGRMGTGYAPAGEAALLITLDKADFAQAMGRARAYEHIPTHVGAEVLYRVGNFMISPTGPIERAFDSESEPSGTPWEGLSDLQKEMRGGVDGPILNETGALKEAALDFGKVASIAVGGRYARMILSPERLTNDGGNQRFKFFVHQLGSDNGWGRGIRIPARPFFPTSPDDLTPGEHRRIVTIMRQGIWQGIEDRADIRGTRAIHRRGNY
jgi:phage gpG-like protein